MARRVGRGNAAERCPKDFATFAYIAPKQELEQIFPGNDIAGIAEQHLRGRALERRTRKIRNVRQRKLVLPMVWVGAQRDRQFEARAGSARRSGQYRIEPLCYPVDESRINRVPLAPIESIEWLSGIMHAKVCLQVDGTLLAVDFNRNSEGIVRYSGDIQRGESERFLFGLLQQIGHFVLSNVLRDEETIAQQKNTNPRGSESLLDFGMKPVANVNFL